MMFYVSSFLFIFIVIIIIIFFIFIKHIHIIEEDAEGYVFIDRDPSLFISVLQYLREGRDAMQETVLKANRLAVNRELRYYGLQVMAPPMIDVVVYIGFKNSF